MPVAAFRVIKFPSASPGEDQPSCRGKHAAPESSQKVLLVRKLLVDRCRRIDIINTLRVLACLSPRDSHKETHKETQPCVDVYSRFSPWRFRCLVPSVGQPPVAA